MVSMNGPMPQASDVRKLLERFQRAGWISVFSAIGDSFDLQYTPTGILRIKTLREGFKDLKHSDYEITSLAAGETRDCMAELLPPNFSGLEILALFGFIWQLDVR